MKTTRMRGADRKAAIVEAALPLFAQHGFAATTTRELAKAAGVSEALIYKHFPSKEMLYSEIKGFGRQGKDSELTKVLELEPCTRTLILVMYATMVRFVIGKGGGQVSWETRVRLMLHSCLEDGAFMRHIFKNAFVDVMDQLERSIEVAEADGDFVRTPVSSQNRIMFIHHVAIMIGSMHLPETNAVEYDGTKDELLRQSLWFALRGLGLKDEVIKKHLNMKALDRDLQRALAA